MLLQFQIAELASFLKYGITGLSAIAFILSYFLLYREGNRAKPRAEYLSSIKMFMWLTLILGVVSAYVSIKNPFTASAEPDRPAKRTATKTQKRNFAPKKDQVSDWKVEIFYDKKMRKTALEAKEAIELGSDDFEVVVTPLDAQKKQELRIRGSQIRYEASEKNKATVLQQDLEGVLEGQNPALKLINSSSPNYISVFLIN